MRGIVGPCGTSAQAAAPACVEIVPVNEAVIDEDAVIAPARTPTISAPTTPASSEIKSHVDPKSKSEVRASIERWVKPTRVRIVKRRAPDGDRIVIWQVHHIRIGRLDVDDGRSGAVRGDYPLLTRRVQFPGLLRFEPHSLDCVHYVRLLSEKSVSKICRPRDVLVQAFDEVWKNDQRLDAGVPVLLLRRLGESRACEPGVPLEPLRGLHQFERIRRGHQYLAQ